MTPGIDDLPSPLAFMIVLPNPTFVVTAYTYSVQLSGIVYCGERPQPWGAQEHDG